MRVVGNGLGKSVGLVDNFPGVSDGFSDGLMLGDVNTFSGRVDGYCDDLSLGDGLGGCDGRFVSVCWVGESVGVVGQVLGTTEGYPDG